MFPAARKTDPITHDLLVPSGVIAPPITGPCPGVGPVMIEALPAAHVFCTVACTGATSGGPLHPPPPLPPPIVMGAPAVLIHGMPAARWAPSGDIGGCGVFLGDPKLAATRTVLIGGPATGLSGPLSPALAKALFDYLAAMDDIAFGYPRDGCYARAHLMVQRMQQMGIDPGKVWSFANPDSLRANTPNVPEGYVEWGYHVAPTVPVQQPDGSVKDMVVDPSMFDRPVTVDQWRDAQQAPGTSQPHISQTRPGEAPTAADGTQYPGSGYWPAPDPVEGADQQARDTMDDYLTKEGT